MCIRFFASDYIWPQNTFEEKSQCDFALGFPRVGTSRCPFVPGQGQEQMSQDKHLCPGTSRDKITSPKEHKKQEKDVLKQEKDSQNQV